MSVSIPLLYNISSAFSIFGIKELDSSINTDSYYKTIGYAGLLIEQSGRTGECINTDISLSFLCMHYLKKLIKHLTKIRHLRVEKTALEGHYIIKEIFNAQIIVIHELSPMTSCTFGILQPTYHIMTRLRGLQMTIASTRSRKYIRYLDQGTNANNKIQDGGQTVVCE